MRQRVSMGGTMPDIPADLRYSKDHLWPRPCAGVGVVRVGVTDFAQQSLGDVVDVTLPRPGDTVQAGQACGDIESVKSVSDLIAPVTGTVRTRNHDLADAAPGSARGTHLAVTDIGTVGIPVSRLWHAVPCFPLHQRSLAPTARGVPDLSPGLAVAPMAGLNRCASSSSRC
jgi:glycine cleavage system H lipoate-binding protein